MQFDNAGTVLNSIQIANADFHGVIVFTSGGKVWTYGESSSSSILIAVNDDFTIASNKLFASS